MKVRWILLMLVGMCTISPSLAVADIYSYQGKEGEIIVTTEPRNDLKLIDVIRDDSSKNSKKSKKKQVDVDVPDNESYSRPSNYYDDLIREAAETYQLPFAFIKAVIKAESGFNPYAVSRAGALGLMQLMPGTAAMLGVEDSFDPRQNVFGGTKLLRILTNRYNGDINLILSAYNAGDGAVERYQGIPYEGTRNYIVRIYKYYREYQEIEDSRVYEAEAEPEVEPESEYLE